MGKPAPSAELRVQDSDLRWLPDYVSAAAEWFWRSEYAGPEPTSWYFVTGERVVDAIPFP